MSTQRWAPKEDVPAFSVVLARDPKGGEHHIYFTERGDMVSYHQLPLPEGFEPTEFQLAVAEG